MGTILHLIPRPVVPAAAQLPPGCKGAACPAFARCQGRCETKREAILARLAAPTPHPVPA